LRTLRTRVPPFGDALLTLDAERAVEVARLLGARRILPVHCEEWAHYSQGLDDFRSRFDEAGLSERVLILLRAPW
jgi:L-ascorbate metabolism protein UlaG (beta-lactamase superfamily)